MQFWHFACLTALLLLLASCSPTPSVRATNADSKRASVLVAKAVRGDLANSLEISAEFRPYQEIEVHAKIAGYLKQITVDVGDRVRQGQLIAVLEVPEMAQDLLQATATEKRTELDVARAKSEVVRAETTRRIRDISFNRLAAVAKTRPNLIAQQEIDDAEARLRESEAQVATARAALAATEEQVRVSGASKARVGAMLSYLRITAPFAGVITKRYADPGAMIQAGTASQSQAMPVVRLSQIDRLRLVLPVPESMVSRVKAGSPVDVHVSSLSAHLKGRVTRFTGRLETATRTMEAEVEIPNPQGKLMPGMYAIATLQLDQRVETLMLPVQAFPGGARPGERRDMFVVRPNGLVAKAKVTTGLETEEHVEVTGGLSDGDLVVIGSAPRPGQRVQTRMLTVSEAAH